MKKKIVLLVSSAFLVFTFFAGILSDNGKAGATGSPGENNCTQCHNTYAVNSGSGSIVITSNMTNWEYVPGQTYTITVTVAQTGKSLFGMGFEALQSSGANAGTLTPGTGTTSKNATVAGNSRKNIVHTLNGGASSGSHTFTFTWLAPASNIGNVTFYVAGNACNANGSDTGDYVYTASQVVTPAAVGIDEVELDNAFINAYPNPFSNELRLQFSVNTTSKVQITIMDLAGKIVLNKTEVKSSGTHQEILNVSDLKEGMYIATFAIDGKIYSSQRVVKK